MKGSAESCLTIGLCSASVHTEQPVQSVCCSDRPSRPLSLSQIILNFGSKNPFQGLRNSTGCVLSIKSIIILIAGRQAGQAGLSIMMAVLSWSYTPLSVYKVSEVSDIVLQRTSSRVPAKEHIIILEEEQAGRQAGWVFVCLCRPVQPSPVQSEPILDCGDKAQPAQTCSFSPPRTRELISQYFTILPSTLSPLGNCSHHRSLSRAGARIVEQFMFLRSPVFTLHI